MGADEEGTLARLKAHRGELIDPKIKEHRGRVVKTTGDGIPIEFPSVIEAVSCAVAVQRGMGVQQPLTRRHERQHPGRGQ
jgi:class 3 adenylate cyclase